MNSFTQFDCGSHDVDNDDDDAFGKKSHKHFMILIIHSICFCLGSFKLRHCSKKKKNSRMICDVVILISLSALNILLSAVYKCRKGLTSNMYNYSIRKIN